MSAELNKKKIWNQFLELAKNRIPKSSFQTWIQPANLKEIQSEKKQVILEVRNQFSKNLIAQNYYKVIVELFEELTEQDSLELLIEVNNALQVESKNYAPSLSFLADSAEKRAGDRLRNKENASNLDSRFSFDDFIVGPHNQFAQAVALAVAHNFPKLVYNPFFIYGEVGLGKTHLMQSVGNYIQKNFSIENEQLKILYITAERFLNDLIENMKKNRMNSFRTKYRSVNLLLIDDIQFIEGKEATQEEFFHTFNALRDSKRQIILTSDRPPSAIPKLEKRLQSRFEAGLIVDIQAPSYETRVAIIQKKSLELSLDLSRELIEFLAENLTNNIRTIEGVLNKIQAYTSFTCQEASLKMVQDLLKLNNDNKVKLRDQKGNTKENSKKQKELIEKVSQLVAEKTGLTQEEVTDPENSQRDILDARHICITLSRWAGVSLVQLKAFFNKENSSLLNSINRVNKKSKENTEFSKFIKDLYDQVKEF